MDHGHQHTKAASTMEPSGLEPSGWLDTFSQNGFMPHGHCYLWKSDLVMLHVISDFLIGAAYVAISILLYLLVRKIRLPFGPIFIAFGVFIGACGMTHFMEVWTLWHPDYWASGFVKAITALASVATGMALHRISPKIMEFAHTARLSEERKTKLESAHAELEILYGRIKESDILKTQFFANVSHELRTPLALVLGPIEEILADSQLTANQRQKLDVVLRNSKTLLKQVNDLLDIAKLESGRMTPTYAQSDLVQQFRYVAAHFETVMQARNIFFALHAPDSIPAEIDPDKMQRVFMNLLSNAIKFIPDGGRIRASMQAEGEHCIFTIEDTGPGISPELRPYIFERFRQGEGGVNRKVGGTGLGLAIVKDFVEMHGGTITLQTEHLHGASFTVRLPLKAPAGTPVLRPSEVVKSDVTESMLAGSVQQITPQPNVLLPAVPRDGRPTILVCEDNPDLNQFVSETLAKDFNVLRARDGREGLEMASAARPDLIVSDIMMPYMSGDELVRELKATQDLSHIPILLLSARADDEMRFRLLRDGASDYVVKPFAPEELRARVSNLVSLKLTRDILETEVNLKSASLDELARELSAKKRETETAFEAANAARAESERASAVKSAFLRLVSHELNTPLMAMTLTIQILQRKGREKLDEQQRILVDRLSSSAKQLKSLIDGLLEYVRGGQQNNSKSDSVDLGALITASVDEFTTMAAEKNLQLKGTLENQVRPVQTDAMKLKVILNNLIVNALKFTESGGVELKAEEKTDGVYLSVRDSGHGIPKEDLDRIFEPFERVEPLERKSIPGLGLGLALVKQLSETIGARILVTSEVGKGTTFTVVLPQDRPH